MLTIVQNRPTAPAKRLNVAIAHLEAAVVHINNEAQCRIPFAGDGQPRQVEELSLVVRALSDVIDMLRSTGLDPAQANRTAEHDSPALVTRATANSKPH
jgi:hypothetical protein